MADDSALSHQQRAREALKKFRIVFSSVKKHFQDVETNCGVSGAQLWAVAEINQAPGLRVTELARAMSVHQSTASNLLADLERQGIIEKQRTGADQRVVRLYLSEKGRDLVGRAPQPMIGVLPDALQNLPTDLLDSLSANMDALISLMRSKDPKAAQKPLSDL